MSERHRYLPADDRRKDLLDATGRLFERGGIDAITMTSVAQEAGVSRALIYQYFPDQDTLTVAFFDDRISAYFAAIDSSLDGTASPTERALAGLRELSQLSAGHLAAVRTVLASHDSRLAEVRARLRATTLERWEVFLDSTSDRSIAAVATEVIIGALATVAGQPRLSSTFAVMRSICGSRPARPCAQSVEPDVTTVPPAADV
jgi:AcrR family transcriptional regulator